MDFYNLGGRDRKMVSATSFFEIVGKWKLITDKNIYKNHFLLIESCVLNFYHEKKKNGNSKFKKFSI
jgi:hypothetical protein